MSAVKLKARDQRASQGSDGLGRISAESMILLVKINL